MTGVLILRKKIEPYDVSPLYLNELKPGMYIIEITDNKSFNEFDKLILY